MVGESETVSRGFSAALNGAIWVGGFLGVFVTIFVIATTFDSLKGRSNERTRTRIGAEEQERPEEASMGLSPAVTQ